MSERGYFSLRYAIPGYTFILLVIAINHVPLIKILEMTKGSEILAAFLAFLSLFAGSALGWLVCQFYWWWFQRHYGILGIKEFQKTLNTLVKKYRLGKPDQWDKDTKWKVLAVFDYLSHSVQEEEENLFEFQTRRWDMYHLLSSTYHTLWIGVAIALPLRLYLEYFFVQPLYEIPFQGIIWNPLENAELVALVAIFVIVASLTVILTRGKQRIITEYTNITEARIRSCEVTPDQIKIAFPSITRAISERPSSF